MANTTTADPKLDPYTAKAEKTEHTPQEKIDGFKGIVKNVHTAMMVTRGKDGSLHSRAMTPTQWESLRFMFVFNNVSHKGEEIEADSHVNLSFYDSSTTNWASVSGKANIINDPAKIKENWSSFMKGYFGKVDSQHPGNENDPRVSLIEVVPENIRYWVATSNKLVQSVKTAASAITGSGDPPGELRIITSQELQLVEGLNQTHV
ncbi:hypothetical protein EXIGLDRAFT_738804 [Exidia glandulosa HHB12029]|uniref:General stress protein FMN-binding split barrel domain-containing protein n=1 Tax=Exidia glandulosa HHB12029 TaxID=1314781 RepID=A0A165N5P9_EXIGL|nr:hypothetical protein EXIGLDRAFT_738804 [Exidia glandulosa HHB12029]